MSDPIRCLEIQLLGQTHQRFTQLCAPVLTLLLGKQTELGFQHGGTRWPGAMSGFYSAVGISAEVFRDGLSIVVSVLSSTIAANAHWMSSHSFSNVKSCKTASRLGNLNPDAITPVGDMGPCHAPRTMASSVTAGLVRPFACAYWTSSTCFLRCKWAYRYFSSPPR